MSHKTEKSPDVFKLAQSAVDDGILAIEVRLSYGRKTPFELSKKTKKMLRYHLAGAIAANIVSERKGEHNEQCFRPEREANGETTANTGSSERHDATGSGDL